MTQSTPYLPDPYLKELADSSEPLNIRLTNDFAFKKTFRNKKALTGLLSSLLDIPVREITGIEFPDTFLHGEYREDHEGILDVKVILDHTRKINIEIQMHTYPYWEERSLFYLSKMYTEDFQKGEDYSVMNECIHISILGFDLMQTDCFYSIIKLMDTLDHQVYSSKMSLRVLYLNQLKDATEEERETIVYRWARLISAHDWEVLRKMADTDEYMNAAVEEMEKINADKDLRYRYLMREKAASDEATIRNYYTQKGREEGLEEGHRTGRIEGEECFASLTEKLLKDARTEDLQRASQDRVFRESLYKEYNIKSSN